MYDLICEIFKKTGNIEAYLYIKNYRELEKDSE